MIDSIPEELKDDAKRLLQFLVYSEQTVTLGQAIDFIATQIDTEPRGFNVKRRVFDKASVLKHCPGLVTTSGGDYDYYDDIQLAHFSVKEYLRGHDGFDISQANFVIMRTCIYYLRSVSKASTATYGSKLANYALSYWLHHADLAEGGEADSATTTIVEALHTRANCRHWTTRFVIAYRPTPRYPMLKDYGCLGRDGPELEQAVQSLRRMGANANELFWACAFGLRRTAQRLLNEGANAKFQHWFYGNPLTAACWGRSIETVQLLLKNGADVNAQGGFYGSALIAACTGNSLEIVRLLIDSGADINARGGYYSHALIAASYYEHIEIVQLLLNHQADVNARGEWLVDALTTASWLLNLPIMRILLANGADVNVSGGPTGDVFSATSWNPSAKLRRLILASGNSIKNLEGGHNDNALSAAAGPRPWLAPDNWNWLASESVELLLDRGANPEIRGVTGRTPLSWAASFRSEDIMRILLKTGRVDPDTRDNNGRTPLSWATKFGTQDIMRIILETDRVDPDARDDNGRTPQSWASSSIFPWPDDDPLKLLLEIGRDDANSKGITGRSTLSYANNCVERTECAEAPLPNSVVDINSRDDKGRTPLFWAVDCRSVYHVDALLESGLADIATMDDYGTNLLQLATFKGDEKMMKRLVKWGAPEGPDFYGLRALFGDA